MKATGKTKHNKHFKPIQVAFKLSTNQPLIQPAACTGKWHQQQKYTSIGSSSPPASFLSINFQFNKYDRNIHIVRNLQIDGGTNESVCLCVLMTFIRVRLCTNVYLSAKLYNNTKMVLAGRILGGLVFVIWSGIRRDI